METSRMKKHVKKLTIFDDISGNCAFKKVK